MEMLDADGRGQVGSTSKHPLVVMHKMSPQGAEFELLSREFKSERAVMSLRLYGLGPAPGVRTQRVSASYPFH